MNDRPNEREREKKSREIHEEKSIFNQNYYYYYCRRHQNQKKIKNI